MPGRKSNGFSLIELSLVLVILTALLAGGIALTIALIDQAAYETTKERMDAIQKALHDYVLAFGVLPCPADITAAPDSAAYGVGTGTSASCTPSCSAANFTSGETVAGMVPVKTLRLMDKYAVDGWGSRILYAVDRRLTTGGGLAQYEDYPAIGSITVRDDAGGDRTTHAVYVLASHGSNKHGGFPITGGSLRRPAGSTNADELKNCDCDATGTSTAFNATFVQRFPVSDPAQTSDRFDDIVRYGNYGDFGADRYGTVACACPLPWGCTLPHGESVTAYQSLVAPALCQSETRSCANAVLSGSYPYPCCTVIGAGTGMRADGGAAGDQSGSGVAAGDINGDGIDDVIVSAPAADPGGLSDAGSTYAVFGTDQAWPATVNLGSLADPVSASPCPMPSCVQIASGSSSTQTESFFTRLGRTLVTTSSTGGANSHDASSGSPVRSARGGPSHAGLPGAGATTAGARRSGGGNRRGRCSGGR